ncbi:unnamed protein product [Prorocentrum cordatum]|uniref:Uncharacterized protein n=1 Tax=Prorocentrum cordatum TaxID=2364126 RepID=A0ABN9S0P5_9DINO|nr:unnamed protein product [Polarella glacialis]
MCYSLEAVDVTLEADVGGQPWHCSLPSVRLRSVFQGLEDLWGRALWAHSGASVTRGVSDPLGARGDSEHCWWDHPRADSPPALSEPSEFRPSGHSAGELISELERRAEGERRAAEAERGRAARLEARLGEVLRLVRDWPAGPLPLALQQLVAARDEGGGSDGGAAAASSPQRHALGGLPPASGSPCAAPGMGPKESMAVYDLDVGKVVSHRIDGLRRGHMVQWSVEELQGLTVDVTAIVRSSCKLHSARRLRDTVRTISCRDVFVVTDDFEDRHLPFALEIHIDGACVVPPLSVVSRPQHRDMFSDVFSGMWVSLSSPEGQHRHRAIGSRMGGPCALERTRVWRDRSGVRDPSRLFVDEGRMSPLQH